MPHITTAGMASVQDTNMLARTLMFSMFERARGSLARASTPGVCRVERRKFKPWPYHVQS